MGSAEQQPSGPPLDVAIVGAGISGIGMAAHLAKRCPGHRYAILERREAMGGTWDLFRYPGVRSDSDMETLGFGFEPWRQEKSIAQGGEIRDYLADVARRRGIVPHIRFGTKGLAANWDSTSALWTLTIEDAAGHRSQILARFLYLGAGYYDHDEPHEADFAGKEHFRGTIVHPQFWPQDFDYCGKRVVVVGSGATAVTLVPAMANEAAHVTMLQRTPTWYAIRPSVDRAAVRLRRLLPARLAYAITRWKNVRFQDLVFRTARAEPGKVRRALTRMVQQALGNNYDPASFTPPYDPWEQRLCLVPDGDLFEAIKAGKAAIETGQIERFDETGICLADGRYIPADVIVTATGLKLAIAGKIALSLDGQPLDLAQHYFYKSCMFSNVPNLAMVFGYLNASWTLRADMVADYVCRLLRRMKRRQAAVAVPLMVEGQEPEAVQPFDFTSGYLQRSRHLMPKSAADEPWRLGQDYLKDKAWLKKNPLEDGIMRFTRIGKRSIG